MTMARNHQFRKNVLILFYITTFITSTIAQTQGLVVDSECIPFESIESIPDTTDFNHTVGWIKVMSCIEWPTAAFTYHYDELLLAPRAVSIKFQPPGGTSHPNYTERVIIAKVNSNPIEALNDNKETSYQYNPATGLVAGYSDTSNWITYSASANGTLWNSCYGGVVAGVPLNISDSIYWACNNGVNGLHVLPDQSDSTGITTHCDWRFGKSLGINMEILFGFIPEICPTIDPTLYPTIDPTMAPTAYPTLSPTTNPTIVPTEVLLQNLATGECAKQDTGSEIPTRGPCVFSDQAFRWEITTISGDNFQISNVNTGQCLTVRCYCVWDCIPADGHCVDMDICTGNHNQTFYKSGESAGYFNIKRADNAFCVFNNADGRFGAAGCNTGYNDQRWTELDTVSPTTNPTPDPTINPTINPTPHPTINPTINPTPDPTINPTINPTPDPTIIPTIYPTTDPTISPTINPTIYPTINPTTNSATLLTLDPTLDPIIDPTTHPTVYPTKHPSAFPLRNPTMEPTITRLTPTIDPTISPTSNPTSAPTPQDVYCNEPGIATDEDGDYEYFVYIEETSIVRFDTCNTRNLFDIFIINTNDSDTNYSCSRCGSICYEPSQYQEVLPNGKYLMQIDGPHAFKVICSPKSDSDAPTSSPTTHSPTKTPTSYPTQNPITARPTESQQPVFNASFPDNGAPLSDYTFLNDPYGRFESYIQIQIEDKDNVLGVTALCTECFIWQYRLYDGVWVDIEHSNNNDISVSVHTINTNYVNGITKYQTQLTVQSTRRLNAGYCFDENDNSRIFIPGNTYQLRLKFLVDNDYFLSATSNALSIETNTLPFGGICIIQNIDNLEPLMEYNLFCDGWNDAENLEYNALLENVLMSKSAFVDDARELSSIAPVGNVSITVLIQEKNMDKAITCYYIDAQFKSITETINDKLNQNTSQNASSIVSDILTQISAISNRTSLSENPDVAVSIVTVIEDIYTHNLTTQNEASHIIDDIIGNIVDGSGVLDIVIKYKTDNISWVVLEGEDIITELAAIATITSNEDIVDAETTTTVLVNSYLPQIFEAIDVFIYVSTALDTETENGSITEQSVLQDQLYVIAEQSQDVIDNLEATLQVTLEAVEAFSDEESKTTEQITLLAQSLVDYATLAASKALTQSDVGETFNYENVQYNDDGTIANKKIINATKFDANVVDFNDNSINETDIVLPKCGNNAENIELPLSFMKDQSGVFDCVFMVSSRNNFVSKQNRTQKSDTVSINLYGENTDDYSSSSSSRRNLLQYILYESDRCFPYLITMELTNEFTYNLDMILDKQYVFPSCDFWNTNESLWDPTGCFVYSITNNTVTCGCTHLTTFSLSEDEIIPEANFLTDIDWRQLTFTNFVRYPTVWVTCLVIFTLFMVLCWINPKSGQIRTKSIIAFEDVIYETVRRKELVEDILGKEIDCFTDFPNQDNIGYGLHKIASTKKAKKSICVLQFKLFKSYLRNAHTLLSVFQRTAGTNFSVKQRLGCFFMYLCTIMVVTATFYGLEQSTYVQDVLQSFITSLCGTLPVFIVKNLFEKSKPIVVKSTKHKFEENQEIEIENNEDSNEDIEGEGGNSERKTHRIRTSQTWRNFDLEAHMLGNSTISSLDEEMQKYYDKKNKEDKIRVVSEIRKVLFNDMYPLPHYFKKIGWVILTVWSMATCVTAIVYGFKFDVEATEKDNTNNANFNLYKNNDCWDTTLALQIEADLSEEKFLADYMEQEAMNASSYAGGDAKSWLLSIFQSLLTSLILWQPLTVYVTTWVRIWMFSWHLKMSFKPGNIGLLCKRCCCGYNAEPDDDDEDEDDDDDVADDEDEIKPKSKLQMLTQYFSGSIYRTKTETRSYRKILAHSVVAHKNRPVDIISFLGNDNWVIGEHDTDKGKTANTGDDETQDQKQVEVELPNMKSSSIQEPKSKSQRKLDALNQAQTFASEQEEAAELIMNNKENERAVLLEETDDDDDEAI